MEKALTPADRFRIAMDLFETGVELMRQNLKRDHPNDSEAEIAKRLRAWLHHRPGAEFGDCEGRRVDWPRKSR